MAWAQCWVIPSEIGKLSNISTLALGKKRLTGVIPTSVQNLSKLETLELEKNMLSREIPSWLFRKKALKNLFLGGNNLTWNNNLKIVPKCMLSKLSLKSCGLCFYGSGGEFLRDDVKDSTVESNQKLFLPDLWRAKLNGLNLSSLDQEACESPQVPFMKDGNGFNLAFLSQCWPESPSLADSFFS
ncbi:hypothetical protein RJ639_045615 [Escallonia herrerae]|uniref:Uncharacterized protein n=1 Tax=Escallonia herrerae TaxID=1293975 RepID=A0AA88WB05_9ASTE|nr:hypothetical protein RJ639_045615 [Escallonia herrerae]